MKYIILLALIITSHCESFMSNNNQPSNAPSNAPINNNYYCVGTNGIIRTRCGPSKSHFRHFINSFIN